MQNDKKNRILWQPEKLFVSEATKTKFAVRISKLQLFVKDRDGNPDPRRPLNPKFSLEVGQMLPPKVNAKDNAQHKPQEVAYDANTWRFVTHFNFEFTNHNGVVYDADKGGHESPESIINALLAQARSWIREQFQQLEDQRISRKQEREQRDINRNKQFTNHTGKTARKKAQTNGVQADARS